MACPLRVAFILLVFSLLPLLTTGCSSPAPAPTPVSQTIGNVVATTGLAPRTQSTSLPPVTEEILFEEPYLPLVLVPDRLKKVLKPKGTSSDTTPRIAIIIDDMGYHPKVGDHLLDLPLDITFSFLPRAPFSKEQEEKAFQLGRDILVHLPMEAQDSSWDPGPGTLRVQDGDAELTEAAGQLLDQVPHAIGANNHMGSKFSEDQRAMRQVLKAIQARGMFYIDSFTTAASTGLRTAEEMGIPTARRHVFLDNVHEPDKICRQLELLVRRAEQQGTAIGIGHPNQATLTALTSCSEALSGVEVVGVHALLQERKP